MTIRTFSTRLAGMALLCAATLAPPPALAATESQAYDTEYDAEPVVIEVLTDEQLEDLVGPVALYPDDLLAVVLPASTYPLQIVQAARLLDKLEVDPDLKPDPEWDESVVALLNYPEVIALMNDDLDWTYALGDAVVTQQTDVISAIERFRDRAWEAGNLRTDEHVEVVREEEVIRITPVEQEIVYVPYYEPERVVVYQSAPVVHYYPRRYPLYYYPYPDHYAFGSGFFFGITTAYQIGWGSPFIHLQRHSYASHPFYGRRYLPRHYYHERFHRPYRRALSRGNYAAPRGGSRRADRAYRGDRWQAGARHGARPRAAHRTARDGSRTITRNTFRARNPDARRTAPRDTRRDLRARRDGVSNAATGRAARGNRDAALRSRTDRSVSERRDPRDRSAAVERGRRNATSTVALAGRPDRRGRAADTGVASGNRADRQRRERRNGAAGAERTNRSALTTARANQPRASSSQGAERRAALRAAQRAENRAERRSTSRVPADTARRSGQRERRAAPAEQARQPRRAAQREASRSRAPREARSARAPERKAERSGRRSEARAEKGSRDSSGGDAGRRSESRKRDRR